MEETKHIQLIDGRTGGMVGFLLAIRWTFSICANMSSGFVCGTHSFFLSLSWLKHVDVLMSGALLVLGPHQLGTERNNSIGYIYLRMVMRSVLHLNGCRCEHNNKFKHFHKHVVVYWSPN